VLLLVGTLFFTLRLDGISQLRHTPRLVLLTVGVNFLIIPLLGLTLTALLPSDALRLGVLIYCLAPCTDWFLGFTRLAGGDTVTGAALIPIQMMLQLALYPVWIAGFAGEHASVTAAAVGSTLLTWFVFPAGVGLGLRLLLRFTLPTRWRERTVTLVDRKVPLLIAAVIVGVFAGNVRTILADLAAFGWVLLAVFLFFMVTLALGEGIARVFRLNYSERALLTMATSARNAPLMLAVTTVALPNQPMVYAAIILGMLIEFPHLAAITHLLRFRRVSRILQATGPMPHSSPTVRRAVFRV
jgi:ACR3 family arsenite efflux pump ArsB